jgi:hypothetical protein
MISKNSFHVHQGYGLWKISRGGVLFAQCKTKSEAIHTARKLANKHESVVVVHSNSCPIYLLEERRAVS